MFHCYHFLCTHKYTKKQAFITYNTNTGIVEDDWNEPHILHVEKGLICSNWLSVHDWEILEVEEELLEKIHA